MPAFTSKVSLSLSTKLIFGFLLVAVPSVVIVGGISLYAIQELSIVNRHLQEISRSLEATRDLEAAIGRTMLPPTEFLIGGKAGEDQRFHRLMSEVEVQLKSCASAACHGAARQPREMAETLIPYIQRINQSAAAIFAAGRSLPLQDKSQLLEQMNRQGAEVGQQLERMSETLLLRVDSLQRKSLEVSHNARNMIVVFTLSVLGFAVLIAYFISHRLLQPLRGLLLGTRHVMQGDLGYRVAVTEKDEIGELAQSFNVMTAELQQHRVRLEEMVRAKTEELRRAQESLLQTEKLASIGLLASGVAHELNNPLTSILMNVNLLMEEMGERPDVQKELKRIGDDTLRCKRIIDDLRGFSRRHELEIRPSNLNEVARKTLGLIKHELELHGITLHEELSSDIPLILSDPDRMQQVFMNVFVNAIQVMPQGGELTVRSSLRGEFAEITVRDTGPGIPSGIRNKIFDPFFTTKQGGTGLGLSIVYRIMEQHGGRVEVESLTAEEIRAGAAGSTGTKVRLSLPLRADG